ncbi:group II intron maturase-specific domain-containing protein [Streptomyces sp. NPDC059349]|uniref:group II intron maturase-specific domain-containing protein n=1 Tax=Streptomyces sp. NPDC059349 TaxID=3346808 RepID=UPI00367D3721
MKALHGSNAEAVLRRLIPIVRGWAAYYRAVASTTTFASLDHYMWRLTFKWARRRHATSRGTGLWTGTPASSTRPGETDGFSATATASPSSSNSPGPASSATNSSRAERPPDDSALTEYWRDRRRRKAPPPMDETSLLLAVRQQGL